MLFFTVYKRTNVPPQSTESERPQVMKPSSKTRKFYIACLFLRVAVFLSLTAYAIFAPDRFSAELAAERQNKANLAKTPGSLSGNSVTEADEIDRIWAEDD